MALIGSAFETCGGGTKATLLVVLVVVKNGRTANVEGLHNKNDRDVVLEEEERKEDEDSQVDDLCHVAFLIMFVTVISLAIAIVSSSSSM